MEKRGIYRLRRVERLKHRKVIRSLFQKGHSFHHYPLRIVYAEHPDRSVKVPVQFTVSVGKRRFKRAVDRNLLRRRIREAYRSQKPDLYRRLANRQAPPLAVLIIYTGKEILEYTALEKAMQQIVRRLPKRLPVTNS